MGLMRKRSELKETWCQTLAGLALPTSPWTNEDLLRAYVEQVRGRRLVLTRSSLMASPNGPNGMWIVSEDTDRIWVHPAISGVQYNHVLGHELGHMVNGDEPKRLDFDLSSLLRLLRDACSGSTELLAAALAAAGVKCRADGTSGEDSERKAENFGYFAERWVAKMGPRHVTTFEANMRESLDT